MAIGGDWLVYLYLSGALYVKHFGPDARGEELPSFWRLQYRFGDALDMLNEIPRCLLPSGKASSCWLYVGCDIRTDPVYLSTTRPLLLCLSITIFDRCSGCDEDVGTKCEDGHDLTPYRVTFSTEDAEISPDAGCTPATGGTSLSPCMSPTRSRERVCASPGRIIAGLQPSEVGGGENTRAVPSTLPADNEIGESPPTRDLSGEGGATVDTSSSVCAAIAMEMDVDPAKEEGVVAGEPVNGVLEMMALGDGGEQVHVEPPPVDVGGGEGEELAPQPIGGRP